MTHKIVSLVCLIGLATLTFAQAPLTMRPADRVAVSHDGNNYDKDDIYSYAMDYALMWSFGMEKQLVHCQINNLLSSMNSPSFYDKMMASGQARNIFPGFDPSIQFDCVTDWAGAVADFKAKAEQGSESSILYFILSGPMEMAWRSINAVSPEKRQFIHCITSSYWNNTMTNSSAGLNHTWTNLRVSFEGDGVKFTQISDQNVNLGGAGSARWNFLNTMPESSLLPQSTWTWLKAMDWKANGDCSESGMTWYVLTGMQNGTPADFEARFKNPLSSNTGNTFYALSVTSPNGSVTLNPAGGLYTSGTIVTVSVTANPGYSFSGWSGDISGTQNPETVSMNTHKYIMANFTAEPSSLTFRPADRIAISHDGNAMNKDDVYGYAMSYAVIWSFGMAKQLVHCQINNLLAGLNNPMYHEEMMRAGQARTMFPGFDSTIQFDCVNDYERAIADFKAKAEQGSEGSILYFLLNGPMETAWQSIKAVAPEKRKYIHCISNSTWNEGYISADLTHTWADMKASFSADGVRFTDISDQNQYLGLGISAQWNFLSNMPVSSIIPQSTWTWLRLRDWTANGDCSESGTTWYVLTGMQHGKPADFEARFKKPLPPPEAPSYSLTATAVNGSATLNPAGGTYESGTVVTVTVTANPGYSFSNWSGDISGSLNPVTITMNANKSVSATCTPSSQDVQILGSWKEGTIRRKESGTNRALVVLVYGEHRANFSALGVTYGRQSMTKVVDKMFHKSGHRSYTAAFVLSDAKIAAATSDSITVKWSVKPTAGNAISSVFLSNVDQTALFGPTASKGAILASSIATAALANNAGDMVIVAGTADKNGSYTVNNGFTKGIEIANASWGDGVAGFKNATGIKETPKLSQSAAMRQTIIGFVVRKAPGLGKFGVSVARTQESVNLKVVSFSQKSLTFTLPEAQNYSIAVYNLAGAQVMKKVQGLGRKGQNTISLNQSLLANQTFIIQLLCNKKVTIQRLLPVSK